MKAYILTLLLHCVCSPGWSQPTAPPMPHIKIVLVGTFHFGATNDRNHTAFPDLFSARRQAEVQQLATKLAALHPTKFFVENEPRTQAYWDSLYTRFRSRPGDTLGRRNEIVQVGMRTARLAGLPRVTCVDYQQELPYKELDAFNKRIEHDTAALRLLDSYKLFARSYPYPRETEKLANHTLTDYLLYLNSWPAAAGSRADNVVYPPNYGVGNDYTGVAMLTSWYNRNAKIFTNILRSTDPADKVVVLLFGSAHLVPLRHYFQQHPYFEVVELAQVVAPDRPAKATLVKRQGR